MRGRLLLSGSELCKRSEGNTRLSQEVWAFDIQIEGLIKVCFARARQVFVRQESRIESKRVDPSESIHGLFDKFLDVVDLDQMKLRRLLTH